MRLPIPVVFDLPSAILRLGFLTLDALQGLGTYSFMPLALCLTGLAMIDAEPSFGSFEWEWFGVSPPWRSRAELR